MAKFKDDPRYPPYEIPEVYGPKTRYPPMFGHRKRGWKYAVWWRDIMDQAHLRGIEDSADGKPNSPPFNRRMFPDDQAAGCASLMYALGYDENQWGRMSSKAIVQLAVVCRDNPGKYPESEAVLDKVCEDKVLSGLNLVDSKYKIDWRLWKPDLTSEDAGVIRD